MSNFEKLAHSVCECKYHFVWCSKHWFRVLRGDIGRSVQEIIEQLCDWKKLEILELNILRDQIHLILSIPPKYSVSEVVGFLKGKSAIKVLDRYPGLKKRYWGRHFWAKGYCTLAIRERKEHRTTQDLEILRPF